MTVTKKNYSTPVICTVEAPAQIDLCSPTKPIDCDVQAGGGVCAGTCGATPAVCDVICPPF